jgi:hypothetical protein
LLKNRLLTLYKALENQVLSEKTSGVEKARCAEIAASIALDVLKMESESIRAVKELGFSSTAEVAKNNALNSLRNDNNNHGKIDDNDNDNDNDHGPDNNNSRHHYDHNPQHQEEDDNRKF